MADLTGRMIGAMKADVKTFNEIEQDPNAFTQAITVIVIAGIASLIGNIFRLGIIAGVIGVVARLIGFALFALFVFLIGTKLMPEPSTKSDFYETFRTVGFAASPGVFYVAAIIPYLGPLISLVIGIWGLVLAVIAVREALDYTNTGRAIIVCVIAAGACLLIYMLILVPILAAMFITRAAF